MSIGRHSINTGSIGGVPQTYAIYPALIQGYGSREGRLNGRQLDRAPNGSVMTRVFYASEKKTFDIVHPGITAAQKEEVEAFYTENQFTHFLFVWNGDTLSYLCVFSDQEPTYTRTGYDEWDVTIPLLQV